MFTIAYDLIAMLTQTFTEEHVTNEDKVNKSKGFKFFDKCFYSFVQAKCVQLTFKLLINIEKST